MAEDQRPGTIWWIDHFAVPSNDLDRWIKFQINVVGAELNRINGLTTEARQRGQGGVAAFCKTPYSMVDGFLADKQLPAPAEPGFLLAARDDERKPPSPPPAEEPAP